MIISEARLAANRRNAQRSTGPATAGGKARSRANALKHGLTAEVVGGVGPDEERRRAGRVAALRDRFGPRDEWENCLVEQLAGATLRLGRIEAMDAKLRDVAAWRAATLWDEDRRLEVEEIGSKLGRDPARVVALLRQSPHGCAWLIERWAMLARIAEANGPDGWDDEQTQLAHDLLGIPDVGRVGPVGSIVDEAGRVVGSAADPAALARAAVADLQEHRETVAEADEIARSLVLAGLDDAPSPAAVHLRRYERAAQRRFFWLAAQLREAGLTPQHVPTPVPIPAPAVAPPASVAPAPPTPVAATTPPPPVAPNEPTTPPATGRTNPPPAPAVAPPNPRAASDPARKRPDVAQLNRRACRAG